MILIFTFKAVYQNQNQPHNDAIFLHSRQHSKTKTPPLPKWKEKEAEDEDDEEDNVVEADPI